MYMLVMVLDDSAHLNEVLAAWERAGARGVTILESTGVNRVLQRAQPGSVYAGFSQIFGAGRVGHNTLFTIIRDLAVAEAAVQETEQVIGSLHNPHTGIMFVTPVVQIWGLLTPATEQP